MNCGQPRQEGFHRIREQLKREVHIGKQGIPATALGRLGDIKQRALRRKFIARDISMPTFTCGIG